MISQREIARRLGLSVMTISRALRGHPDLSPATRERIIDEATKLGYSKDIPPSPTSADTEPRTRRMGLVAYGPDMTPLFESETPRRIYLAIQQECQHNGAETLVEFLPHPAETPMLLRKKNVRGIFLFGRYTPDVATRFKDVPTLAVSSYIRDNPLPRIVAQNLRGMREATTHLISLGHKKILYLGLDEGDLTELYRERGDGYILAMQASGLKPVLRYNPGYDFHAQLGDIGKFTAIACATDGVAVAVRQQLLERGLDLPGDCSLVGFDGTTEGRELGLSSYSPDWTMMGKVAADLLLFRPQDLLGKALHVVVPGEFIARSSSVKAR
ncbi:LacI family transcriptional regulator [Opitutaceae bacterium TAV4]|nr:LacI family transcriptional regulator [Opitutaceae bacterium TAV4]RRK02029.1 LacI family transcriptional regulator [Opitutaceae bacterium TAV3]